MFFKVPYIISVLTMVTGVAIAILFGINEEIFKGRIAEDLKSNPQITSIANASERKAKFKKEASKNWRYYQRFHFHATGIGAMSLACVILFSFSLSPLVLRMAGSYMVSVGGFLYPFIWLFAGIYGPVMGRSEAKEAFAFFGYMGGVFLLGLLLLLVLLVKYPVKKPVE